MHCILKSFRKIILLVLVFCCIHSQAQQEEPAKETRKRELNINAALVSPVYYAMKIQDSFLGINNRTIIKPDYKFSYTLGVQYKTKKGFLMETQFQPYSFNYKSPIYSIDQGWSGPYPGAAHWVQKYYETFHYTQNRYSLGVGFQKNSKRTVFSMIFGLSYFSGTHSYIDSYFDFKRFDLNGGVYSGGYTTPPDTAILVNLNNVVPYINISYGYKVHKRICITASINYCRLSYGGNSWREMTLLYDITRIHLLSLNIGVKYNFLK